MSDKKEDIIQLRGISQAHPMSATLFLEEFYQKVKEGYVMHPDPKGAKQIPSFVGYPRCLMVTPEMAEKIKPTVAVVEDVAEEELVVVEETVPPIVDIELVDRVEALEAKADLVAIAEELNIEIPSDKKFPKAIKKFLIATIKGE